MITKCPLFQLIRSRNRFTSCYFCCVIHLDLLKKMCFLLYDIPIFTFRNNLLSFLVKLNIFGILLLSFPLCLFFLFLFNEILKLKQIHLWLILQKAYILTFNLILINAAIFRYLLILIRGLLLHFFSVAWKFKAIVLTVHFVIFIIVFRKV